MSERPSARFSRIGKKRFIVGSSDPSAARKILKETFSQESTKCYNEIRTFFASVMGYIHLNKTLKDEILRMIGKFGRYMNFYGDQLDELLQREVDFNAMNTVMERVITLMHDKKDDVIFMMARGLRMRKIEPRLGPRVANNRLMDNFKKETEEIINGVSKSFVYLTERTKKSLVEIRKRENSFETWLEQYERQLRQMIQEGAGFKTVKQTMEANIDHLMEKSIGLKDTIENGR